MAESERVVVKLHGDIGHVWTMAIAGQDKRTSSKLFVRPQLHRMYALAEAMLLDTLWVRPPGVCTWHIVGHGLSDESLCRLIATVIQRTQRSGAEHRVRVVRPPDDSDVSQREGIAERVKRLLCSATPANGGDPSSFAVEWVPCTALAYLTQLTDNGFEAARSGECQFVSTIPPPRSSRTVELAPTKRRHSR